MIYFNVPVHLRFPRKNDWSKNRINFKKSRVSLVGHKVQVFKSYKPEKSKGRLKKLGNKIACDYFYQ